MRARADVDYSTVTEAPGMGASRDQVARLFHRYHLALSICEGKDVLEVGCGAGLGLGYLARKARRVVGGDYALASLLVAQRTYQGRIPLVRLDAHVLPFPDKSFDVVLLYESIYYLSSPERFLTETRRILRAGGVLLICTVNKDWTDFNPSPFSTRYFSSLELVPLLRAHDFDVELSGAFPASTGSMRDKVVSLIKRIAVMLDLIPKTMKHKELLKRIFFGKLVHLPAEVREGLGEYVPPTPLPVDSGDSRYKIVYAVERLNRATGRS